MPSAPILAKARNGNILLAYKMNGVDLSSGARISCQSYRAGW